MSSIEKGRSRALREAAGANNIAGIDAALAGSTEFKALLNSGDYIGKTALHWAAGRGRIEAVRHLLLLGAKVRKADNQQTPLHLLAESGADGASVLVEELVQAAPWSLRHTDMLQNTALERARHSKNAEMVRELLAQYDQEEGFANENEAGRFGAAAQPATRGYLTTLFFGKKEEANAGFQLLVTH
mmetsp:Transcript_14452/g.23760  ORF Transcript_14452/g.23760 Transcript_14452/m.23760 type:complete len:186 (+) Transcript_14452:292-849(+)